MIIGIGNDIIETERVIKACGRRSFLEKVYTVRERELIAEKQSRAAGNFAVKEAVSKVFGTGFSRIRPREIEVLRDGLGKPVVVLHGRAEQLAKELGIARIHVSISDTDSLTTAFAVGEGAENGNGSDSGTDEAH